MNENTYRYLGWSVLVVTVALSLVWCINGTGLAGWLMDHSERWTEHRLTQISCLLTFVTLCLPGYMAKQYFEGLAWQAHLKNIPPPDVQESAKRSKYINIESAPPPAPKPVEVSSLPKGQDEFIATCAACGHYFPAKKSPAGLKCPNCGEAIPIT